MKSRALLLAAALVSLALPALAQELRIGLKAEPNSLDPQYDNVAANNSALNSARESLDRIKKRQEMKQDRMAAGDILAAELSDGGMDAKLEAAGIKGTKADASAVLARIKAGKSS